MSSPSSPFPPSSLTLSATHSSLDPGLDHRPALFHQQFVCFLADHPSFSPSLPPFFFLENTTVSSITYHATTTQTSASRLPYPPAHTLSPHLIAFPSPRISVALSLAAGSDSFFPSLSRRFSSFLGSCLRRPNSRKPPIPTLITTDNNAQQSDTPSPPPITLFYPLPSPFDLFLHLDPEEIFHLMPSQSSNNYAFGPSNTNAAVSNTSHNPFISNASSSSGPQQPRPSPSRSLTGGGHSPLLGGYDDRHHEDMSQNRLLGANMSRQGSTDSMGSVSEARLS